MRRNMLVALALALAATSAAAAEPDGGAVARDVRCIVVTGLAAGSAKEDVAKQGLAAGVSYFMGKLKGRDPNFDLAAALAADVRALKPADIRADMLRCGREMIDFGLEAKAAGEALKSLKADPANSATD